MRRMAALLLLAMALAVGACGREPELPLDQESFVEVMVALRRAAQTSSSTADFQARKVEILQRAGVTEAELRAQARLAPRDAAALATAYDSIAAQLQRFQEPD